MATTTTNPSPTMPATPQADIIMSTSPPSSSAAATTTMQAQSSPPTAARVSIVASASLPIRAASGGATTNAHTAHTAAGTSSSAATAAYPVRKLVRRDSMERREALLKGKEGSRQRRRWENDRLLSNPWAEPPLPSDWEIRPTYPRRNIPYYLAPLWDAAEFQRAVEAKLSGSGFRRGSSAAQRNRNRNRNNKHGSLRYPGMSPIEETATSIPKEVKARLKKSRAAKGLLMDLEESVRGWVRGELGGSGSGTATAAAAAAAGGEAATTGKNGRQRAETKDSIDYDDSGAAVAIMDETDEEDEEIVFVGRKGVVVDNNNANTNPSAFSSSHIARPAAAATSSTSSPLEIPIRTKTHAPAASPKQQQRRHQDNAKEEKDGLTTIHRSKMIFTAPEDDQGAGFARWLVHCVGSYYGLRTWSVTREQGGDDVGADSRRCREAYVGIDERARGFIMARGGGGVGGEIDAMETEEGLVSREIELPRPLWGMV